MRPLIVSEETLLDLLLDAFAELGYEGTSIRSLCRHLEVSHNLIHRRYESKEKAWYAAVDHGWASVIRDLGEAYDPSQDAIEFLRASLGEFVRYTMKRPSLVRIIQHEAARPGPRFTYLFDHHILPFQQRATGPVLDHLVAEGRLRPGDVHAAVFFFATWGLGGLASVDLDTAQLGGGQADRDALGRLAVDILLDGIVKRD